MYWYEDQGERVHLELPVQSLRQGWAIVKEARVVCSQYHIRHHSGLLFTQNFATNDDQSEIF